MQAELFGVLKLALKARGMTYADLATALGTSEPTIKRLFASRDAKLRRLVAICDVLGIAFEDVVAQAQRTEVPPVRLHASVEAQLAERPVLFHLFVLLREGLSPSEAGGVLGVDASELFRLGLALERLGLVEVHGDERIRLSLKGPVAFRWDGRLHGLLQDLNLRFVARAFSAETTDTAGFVTISRHVSPFTAREIMDELKAFSRRVAEAASRDQATHPPERLTAFKLATAWGPVDYRTLVVRTER